MRLRYFITISIVLLSVVIPTILIYNYFLKIQKMNFIDQQVRETASSLINSELGELKIVDFEKVEEIISEELGESRIGKFFIIRNEKNEILFESQSAQLLPVNEISNDSMWVTSEISDRIIRVLNLKLPRIPDRTLQVGLIVESNFINPDYFSKLNFNLFISIMLIGFIASWLLTSFLLKPINKLSRFLSSEDFYQRPISELQLVPIEMFNLHNIFNFNKNDEFSLLILKLNSLISEINKSHKIHRTWAAQMAHEIKTPLSIINIKLENIKDDINTIDKSDIESIGNEINTVSKLINSFLDWAELEKSFREKKLHAIKAHQMTTAIVQRFNLIYKNRIELQFEEDFVIFSEPLHCELLLQNIILNALKYSDHKIKVLVLAPHQITVSDNGCGVPDSVLTRLGEPFNKSSTNSTTKGHGLGLAWVFTIAKFYGWKIKIDSTDRGTDFNIDFSNG